MAAGCMPNQPPPGGDGGVAVDAGGGSGDLCVDGWKAGDYPPNLDQEDYLTISGVPGQQGLTRQYKVHVPPSYDCTKPTPVVFCLHGLGETAVMFCVNGSDFPAKSDEAGFILVMPNGYQNSWNGAGCCGGAGSMNLDDVALMKAILAEVERHLNVDTHRVYATGFSNGGFMSYRLACEAADTFAAVAPASGGIWANGIPFVSDVTNCNPSRPVPVLDIHGSSDPIVPFDSQMAAADHMASVDGCTTMTEPAVVPASGGDTTCVTYSGCPSGVEVTRCSVDGGGHVWFGDPTCGTGVAGACAIVGANSDFLVNTDAVWSFFERLSN